MFGYRIECFKFRIMREKIDLLQILIGDSNMQLWNYVGNICGVFKLLGRSFYLGQLVCQSLGLSVCEKNQICVKKRNFKKI